MSVFMKCENIVERGEAMIVINIRYKGEKGAARAFAEEMLSSGTVNAIRKEEGNVRYEYYSPLEDPESILLIDAWKDQTAVDEHHASPMMETITALREKYDLHMTVERLISTEENRIHPGTAMTGFDVPLIVMFSNASFSVPCQAEYLACLRKQGLTWKACALTNGSGRFVFSRRAPWPPTPAMPAR